MKQYFSLGLTLLLILFVVGCATKRTFYPSTVHETWMSEIERNPMRWTRGADEWFFTGNPYKVDAMNRHASIYDAISNMTVNVPDFTCINVSGNFDVQIFGTNNRNSVYITGPNEAIRGVMVNVVNNALSIVQAKGAPPSIGRVIVRIGVNQLNQLTHNGNGKVEGIQLRSNHLVISSAGNGNIYLSGDLAVAQINQDGCGSINVFGVNTPGINIETTGPGDVNLYGRVCLHNIVHRGTSNINIIGARGMDANIYSEGAGKIGILGDPAAGVGVKDLFTKDAARVYICALNSNTLNAFAYDESVIGLAGNANNVYVETYRRACFQAQGLCAVSAYVKSDAYSHISIAACGKAFASATQNSSVYFYGSTAILTQFANNNGLIIPMGLVGTSTCGLAPRGPTIIKKVSFSGESGYYTSIKRPSRVERRERKYTPIPKTMVNNAEHESRQAAIESDDLKTSEQSPITQYINKSKGAG